MIIVMVTDDLNHRFSLMTTPDRFPPLRVVVYPYLR